jgi:hypothetical protein
MTSLSLLPRPRRQAISTNHSQSKPNHHKQDYETRRGSQTAIKPKPQKKRSKHQACNEDTQVKPQAYSNYKSTHHDASPSTLSGYSAASGCGWIPHYRVSKTNPLDTSCPHFIDAQRAINHPKNAQSSVGTATSRLYHEEKYPTSMVN